MAENKFDIIVYGATSFVGQIITRYMHEQFADGSIVWAIAGRSRSKLQQLSDTIGLSGSSLLWPTRLMRTRWCKCVPGPRS